MQVLLQLTPDVRMWKSAALRSQIVSQPCGLQMPVRCSGG
jgi:hypothetical protein